MTLRALGTALVLILAACTPASGTPSQAPTSASPTEVVSTPAATPAAASCPNPEGGSTNTCLGPIDAGTYQTSTLRPSLEYTVPDGWGNLEDLPGNFLLLPPGATLAGVNPGTSDYLGVYSSVVAPQLCTGNPSTSVAPTWQGLIDWITANPRLAVTNVHEVRVGGLDGEVMDLAMASSEGDGCPDGVWVDVIVGTIDSSLVHSVIPGITMRLYLLRHGDRTLAIEIDDVPAGSDFGDWPTAADEVVATFAFTD